MTTQHPEALRLAWLLELAPEDGVDPQTTEDAAAELRRQHARIAELEARIKTMAEEHADELMVAHLDGRMCAAQPIDAMLGEQAELRRLSDCCPELNLSNYGPDDVDELNWWAIEVSQCIDRALAAQPAGAQQPGAAYAELPSYEHQRAIMEAERNASLDEYSRIVPLTSTESMIYERAFTNGWNRHAHHGQAPAQAAPENIRSILTRCRDFIDTTKAPAYPAGADLADEIDVLLAAQPAPQQPADPWRKAVTDACMPTEACFNGKDPAATINNLIDWHLQNERFHVAQRAQPAAPQQEAQEPAAQEDKSHE